MSEPAHGRNAHSRMRFATDRSARALSDGVSDILIIRTKHRAVVPETVGAALGRVFGDRNTRKGHMVSRIAPNQLIAPAVTL